MDQQNDPPYPVSNAENIFKVPVNPVITDSKSDEGNISKHGLFAEDKGPTIYGVKGNIVTPPLIPKNLPKAFDHFPLGGRPNCKSELEEFLKNKIKSFVGSDLRDEEFEKLAQCCSPDHLRTDKELVMLTSYPGLGLGRADIKKKWESGGDNETAEQDADYDLHTTRKLKLRIETDDRNLYVNRLKYRGMRLMPLADQVNTVDVQPDEEKLEPGKDLLYRVRIYRPMAINTDEKHKSKRRHSLFNCDVYLTGRQCLTELRDRFGCPNDVDLRCDISENPDEIPNTTAKDLFPSGFLFINNVFYVDTRKGCIDYTVPIREWAAMKGFGTFERKDMTKLRLDELVIKLGHPDVYIHQGNCEHIFTFSEVRLVNSTDPLSVRFYPAHTALSLNHTLYCTTCAEFSAKWIVTNCERVPFDPAFFCDTCFKLYLYKDGKKVCDFKAYSHKANEMSVLKPKA